MNRQTVPYAFGAVETADYHVNPQAFKFETAVGQWGFNCLDRDYVDVKAGDPRWSAEFKGVSRKNTNIASVKFKINNANELNPTVAATPTAPAQYVVSVMSLYASDKTNDNKITTSDYAAVVAAPEVLEHLAFVPTVNYTAKQCAGTPVLTAPNDKKMLYESAGEAAENAASVPVQYDKYGEAGFPLNFIGVHVRDNDKITTLAELQQKYPNLDLRYELIDYTVGSNVTSENAFGIIPANQKVFFPAFAKTNAAGNGWTVEKITKTNSIEGISAVGRRPIVLVTLVDTDKTSNNIVLAGYFKIRIDRKVEDPVVVPPVTLQLKDFGEIGYACALIANETKWYDMSYQILEDGLQMTFNDFRGNYTWEADKTYYKQADGTMKLNDSRSDHKDNYGQVTYTKDNASTGDADITGVNDIFKLAVNKAQAENIGVGKTMTLYAHFTKNAGSTLNGKPDHVYIGLTFKVGDKPAVKFIKKNEVYWFDDLNFKYPNDAKTDLGMATIRNNVRVPLTWIKGGTANSPAVTLFDKDIDDDWLVNTTTNKNEVKIVAAATGAVIPGATYFYRFSADNKDITVKGKKWTKVNDGQLNWNATEAITLTNDGVITYLCNDVTKELINWGTNPQEKVENPNLTENFLYCNVDVVAQVQGATQGDICELLVEQIHVRFLRPVYLKFNPAENYLVDGEATGSRVPFGTLFSATDWQNYKIFAYDPATKTYKKGYYNPVDKTNATEANHQVDWYDYYGFTKLSVDLNTVATNQKDPKSNNLTLIKDVNRAAIIGIIDPADPSNPKIYDMNTTGAANVIDIDITDLNNLAGYQFWYANNMGYAEDFKLRVDVSLTYSWGTFTTPIEIPVYGTEHNYQN